MQPKTSTVSETVKPLFQEKLEPVDHGLSLPEMEDALLLEEQLVLQELEAEAKAVNTMISELQLEQVLLEEMETEAKLWGLEIEDLKAEQNALEESCKEFRDQCSMLNANVPAPSHTAPSAFV